VTNPTDQIFAPVLLASGSPRRSELLTGVGLQFLVKAPDVDESVLDGEDPVDYVHRVAMEKARVGVLGSPGSVVIAADTTVAIDGQILAKPDDVADARRMLSLLSGREHHVHTAVVVRCDGQQWSEVVTSAVEISAIDPAWIEWYVSTGEPMGKAGAYAVQGRGAVLVAGVRGSLTNVIGLPVMETCAMLAAAGVQIPGVVPGEIPDPE
jgi:septum formation protein